MLYLATCILNMAGVEQQIRLVSCHETPLLLRGWYVDLHQQRVTFEWQAPSQACCRTPPSPLILFPTYVFQASTSEIIYKARTPLTQLWHENLSLLSTSICFRPQRLSVLCRVAAFAFIHIW